MKTFIVALLAVGAVACGPSRRADDGQTSGTSEDSGAPLFIGDAVAASLVKPNAVRGGDFDWFGERRVIRALVPYSRTFYYVDQAEQGGLAYESLRAFGATLRAKAPRLSRGARIVIIPTSRARLFPALAEGLGDMAIGGFAVTDERAAQVHLSLPTKAGIRDIVVTGPSAPAVASIEALAGLSVYVRQSSSAHADLTALNKTFEEAGKPPIRIVDVDDQLEDEDVLEMVNAGIFPITVVKDLYATAWGKTFDRIVPRPDLVIRDRGSTVWAVRNDAPTLQRLVDDFIINHGSNTDFGGGILQKYFSGNVPLKNPISEQERARLRAARPLLQRYGTEYGLDWMLLGAQAYQESQFDQAKRSAAGAIGVLQITPEVAADPKVGVRGVDTLDNNIHAGAKYLRMIIDQYYADPSIDPLNRSLFALASYHAGPARVAQLRDRTSAAGLNPNLWFYNVEIIASRELGHDTIEYVANVYKYLIAYQTVVDAR